LKISDCNLFIKKWFDGADDLLADIKKTGEEKWISVKFTLATNDSKGNVIYATSTGIFGYVYSLLYYSTRTEGVNRERAFTSLDFDKPDTYYKPNPTIACLFSNRRVGKRVMGRDMWDAYDKRQPFDMETPSLLFLSVSNRGGNIFVKGKIPRKKTKLARVGEAGNFEFVAGCANENILYGFTMSNAFLISFNGFQLTAAFGRGQDWPGHPAEDKIK
jgi:hypothetical protein